MCVRAVLAVADLERRDVNLDLIKVWGGRCWGFEAPRPEEGCGTTSQGGTLPAAARRCGSRGGAGPCHDVPPQRAQHAPRPAAGRQGGGAAGGHGPGERHRAGQGHVAPAGKAPPPLPLQMTLCPCCSHRVRSTALCRRPPARAPRCHGSSPPTPGWTRCGSPAKTARTTAASCAARSDLAASMVPPRLRCRRCPSTCRT